VLATVALSSKHPRRLNLRLPVDLTEQEIEPSDAELEEEFFIEFINEKNQSVYSKH
jgi:hypothetical protein